MSATGAHPARLLTPVRPGRPPGWWGMLLFTVTEAAFFAALLVGYLFIRAKSPVWPPAGIAAPGLTLPAVMTLVLFSTSIAMHLSDRSIKKSRTGRSNVALSAAVALAVIFLGLQAYEYFHKLKEFTPRTNSYGSLFFTITGFHGLHVLAGLAMAVHTLTASVSGRFGANDHLAITNTAFYWHFVDAVWIFVFLTVYLLPNL